MHANWYLMMQFVPLLFWQVIFASLTFVVCRKRHVNPWGWTLLTLIPGIDRLFFLFDRDLVFNS